MTTRVDTYCRLHGRAFAYMLGINKSYDMVGINKSYHMVGIKSYHFTWYYHIVMTWWASIRPITL